MANMVQPMDCQGIPLGSSKGKIVISQQEVRKKVRKGWIVNPKTRVVPNKKRKELTKIEVERIRKQEDF